MDRAFLAPQEPVVIIGMHRSGTSFLARALDACGVFMGADVQGNHESLAFLKINNELFWQCGSTWNQPFGIHVALRDEARVDQLTDYALNRLQETFGDYLGGKGGGDGLSSLQRLNSWGWKDPRNTFTLAIWKRIFPKLRVLHILRHGVDCAQSLYARDWQAYHTEVRPYLPALMVAQDPEGLFHARRGWTLEQNFTLWEEYVEKAKEQLTPLRSRALEIRYEDVLQNPRSVLEKVLGFCSATLLDLPETLIAEVNSDRAYAHRRQPELAAFAWEWQRTLERFSYGCVEDGLKR